MSKIAIVTGGGRGIGKAAALAAAGYDVAISYRQDRGAADEGAIVRLFPRSTAGSAASMRLSTTRASSAAAAASRR